MAASSRRRLLVLGAGGFGASVAEAAEAAGVFEVVGFLDDGNPAATAWGRPILGRASAMASFRGRAECAVVAIGNNEVRGKLLAAVKQAAFDIPAVIHPSAVVSQTASIGEGSLIMAATVVGAHASIGRGVIVNAGAVVDHHAKVHDFAHLGVNACVGGGAELGAGEKLGAGQSVAL